MPSLLLVVFILQLLLHIINTVGANTVNELVGPASTRLIIAGLIDYYIAMDPV